MDVTQTPGWAVAEALIKQLRALNSIDGDYAVQDSTIERLHPYPYEHLRRAVRATLYLAYSDAGYAEPADWAERVLELWSDNLATLAAQHRYILHSLDPRQISPYTS
jgi:hypothetical protein